MEEGIVEVVEEEPMRGRPSQLLGIRPNCWFVIGIKIGREEVRGVLFDAKMNSVKKESVRILSHMRNNEGYAAALLEVIERLWNDKVLAVGICSSGIVSQGRIVVSHLMNVRVLQIEDLLKKSFDIDSVVLMNDVDALAYFLSNQQKGDFLALSYGTGIGASFWSNGHAKHFEMGHAVVANDGKCYCGQTGCLEYHSSEYAVLKSYLGKDIEFQDFVMNEEEKYRPIVEEIRAKARENFESVLSHYVEPFRRLSLVLGNLIMALKPKAVFFLGEGIVGQSMVETLQNLVRSKFNTEFIGDVHFRWAHADWEAGVALAAVRKFMPKILLHR